MILQENERLDEVNDSLKLIQKTNGLTFGTDALLLAAYLTPKYSCGAEFGGGTGIVSLLLLTRGKIDRIDAIEVQEEFTELIKRNAELNGLSHRLTPIFSDVRDYKPQFEYDVVFTNPPYMKSSSGKSNSEEIKNIARHEIKGGVRDFLEAAKSALKYGGDFVAVYRTDRLTDIIAAMRESGIEPKRMTLVLADADSAPTIFLVEGRRGGKCGLRMTKPLIIYRDKEHKLYTGDMQYIMDNGNFPKEFLKR